MVEILNSGLYSTLQDKGRKGNSHLGVPVSGAMDSYSAQLGNMILANNENAAVIECTLVGPKLKFKKSTTIAITGAIIQPFVNNQPVDINCGVQIRENDILSFGRIVKGARFYISVVGGFEGVKILGSHSACITSNILHLLSKGDQIEYSGRILDKYIEIQAKTIGIKTIETIRGPEFVIVNDRVKDWNEIANIKLEVKSSSNRMAYRVDHTLDLRHDLSIISAGVLPGTVQLTPSGELIILMRDAQTTGGYPRVLQLTEKGISSLAQMKAGDHFGFAHLDPVQ